MKIENKDKLLETVIERLEEKITLKSISEELGVSTTTIYYWLSQAGITSIKNWERIGVPMSLVLTPNQCEGMSRFLKTVKYSYKCSNKEEFHSNLVHLMKRWHKIGFDTCQNL